MMLNVSQKAYIVYNRQNLVQVNIIKFSVHHLPSTDGFLPSLFLEAACKSTCHFRSKRMPKFSSLRKRSSFSGPSIRQNMANLYSVFTRMTGHGTMEQRRFSRFQIKNRSCTTMYHLSGGRKLPNADKEDRSNKALPEIQIFTLTYKKPPLKATDSAIYSNTTF